MKKYRIRENSIADWIINLYKAAGLILLVSAPSAVIALL